MIYRITSQDMIHKFLRLFCLVLSVALLPVPSAYAEETAPLSSGPLGASVKDLLIWADGHNLDLAAATHEAEAMEARVDPADSLDDPVFRMELLGIDKNNPDLSPDKVGSTKYTILQSFPVWGKRDLRRDIAQAEWSQARAKSAILKTELHAQIKIAFAMYYQAQHSSEINSEVIALIKNLETIAQTRYINGLAPQQDLLKIQTEQTSLLSEQLSLESEMHHARTRLNYALNRESYATLVDPKELRPLPKVLDAPTLEQRLLAGSPYLATLSSQIQIAEKNRQLTGKDNYPDLTLGISPIQRGNSIDSWDAMVEIKIPIHQENRNAKNKEALALLAAAQDRQQSQINQVVGAFREAHNALGNARSQIDLLKTSLLPQAFLTYESALNGYKQGKVDFSTLLDAQRQIKRTNINLIKAQVEQDNRLTEIERLLGEEL